MKKILVIEDNKDILENTGEILQLAHFKVALADNGKSGIEMALQNKPDLILCDIMMPELDGYAVLHMLQNQPELRDVPFIFLTAKTSPAEIRKGMSLGADDYIIKPFDATDLLNAIEVRIHKAELVDRHAGTDVNELISVVTGEKVLEEFLDGRHVDYYKKKDRIFSEGNHPIRLYYIQKGAVKIYKINDDGKELILNIVKENEFFGYTALLEDTVYHENATALEDCEVASIPKSEFEALMSSNKKVCRKFIRMLAVDVSEKEEQLIQIAYNSLRRKVATAVLSVYERFRGDKEQLQIKLSRENLAAVAGTATESLIRTLTDFKSEKLIDIQDGKIEVINKEKLKKMAN
jgi:CRP-like cAMP-binding protein